MFGLTIETIKPNDYVAYRSPIDVAREQVAALRGQVDILIALTHLDMDQDRVIAEKVPGIDLILGGHEHENAQVHRGPALTPILKADANARTVFVHRLQFDRSARRLKLVSELKVVDRTVPSDPAVEAVVRSWKERVGSRATAQGGGSPASRSIARAPTAWCSLTSCWSALTSGSWG